MLAAAPANTVNPAIEGDTVRMDDGAILPLRSWLPEGKPKRILLAVHGFNDYSNAFESTGTQLKAEGVATFAYDQRGFGQAPDPGAWFGARRMAQDLAEVSKLLHARYPGTPLFIEGESMGGAVAIISATGATGADKPVADGYILLAPAVWGRAYMNIFERGALWFAYNFMPNMRLTGSGLRIMASDNIEMLRALGRDPLVIKATRVEAIEGLVSLMGLANQSGAELKSRVLILYGAHDELIPETPMRAFVNRLPSEAVNKRRIAYYQHGYHMLTRDLAGSTVIADMGAWMADPNTALSSGADQDLPNDWRPQDSRWAKAQPTCCAPSTGP